MSVEINFERSKDWFGNFPPSPDILFPIFAHIGVSSSTACWKGLDVSIKVSRYHHSKQQLINCCYVTLIPPLSKTNQAFVLTAYACFHQKLLVFEIHTKIWFVLYDLFYDSSEAQNIWSHWRNEFAIRSFFLAYTFL